MVFSTKFATHVTAATFIAENAPKLNKEETVDGNFYSRGNLVSVNGTIHGNAYIAGQTVTITGKIDKDLTVAGQNIILDEASISGDVRLFGGEVTIRKSEIGDEVIVAAAKLNIGKDTKINGTTMVASGESVIDASIGEDLITASGSLSSSAIINGSVYIGGRSISLSPEAQVQGDIFYSSDNKAQIDPSTKITGQVHQFPPLQSAPSNNHIRLTIWGILTSLVLGFTIISLFYHKTYELSQILIERTWSSFGWGFATIILTPIISVLLITTLIGLPLGIITLFFYILAIYISRIFMAYTLGRLFIGRGNTDTSQRRWYTLGAGILAYFIITSIPFIGPIFTLFSITLVLGAMFIEGRHWFISRNVKENN